MSDDDAELIRRAEARVGTTLKDKWTIDGLLGVGGMAVVYAATHRNKKRVAIKMLHAGAVGRLRTSRPASFAKATSRTRSTTPAR